jgi:hypothetical protein
VSDILEHGAYVFDVQLKKASADPEYEATVKTVVRSWFLIKRDITVTGEPAAP